MAVALAITFAGERMKGEGEEKEYLHPHSARWRGAVPSSLRERDSPADCYSDSLQPECARPPRAAPT